MSEKCGGERTKNSLQPLFYFSVRRGAMPSYAAGIDTPGLPPTVYALDDVLQALLVKANFAANFLNTRAVISRCWPRSATSIRLLSVE